MVVEPNEDGVNAEMPNVDDSAAKIEIELPEDLEQPGESRGDAQLQEAEERALRAQAELENFRRRARREMEHNLKFANQDLLKDLLPIIDNMFRAVSAASENAEANSLLEGVRMVAQQMLDTLSKHGCDRVSPLGEPFDPNLHEAISQGPSDDFESGQVMLVVQEGYTLHGRVLRPAHVIVSTGPAPNDQ